MALKQISVFLENKPARLLALADILRKNNIDIRALSLSETTDFGVARLIVNSPDAACDILKKSNIVASITPVLAVVLDDKAGGLYNILSVLAEAEINLEYSYAFVLRKLGAACSVLRVDDMTKAETVLKEKGLRLIENIDTAE